MNFGHIKKKNPDDSKQPSLRHHISLGTSGSLWTAGWQTDPSTGRPLSWCIHDRKPMPRVFHLHPLQHIRRWTWPQTSPLVFGEYKPFHPNYLPFASCVWNGWGFFQGFCCAFVVWQQAGGRIKDRALSQHSEAAAAAAARSWFKPLPNQGSTFISRCHYSPAALWQMALWDIGFYGRSSFISNFFSHLMRRSRSSQIQFAVWILIELRTLPLSPPCSLSLPLLFADVCCKSQT